MNQVPISLVKEFMEENNDSQNQEGTGNFQDFNPIHDSQLERERERESKASHQRLLSISFNFQQSETDNNKDPNLETPIQEPEESIIKMKITNNYFT